MAPMIPDCGVLSTPRRYSPLKLCEGGLQAAPHLASLTHRSPKHANFASATPPRPSEITGVTLSSGFNFGFYKSPKSTVVPYHKAEPLPVCKKIKRPRDGINKGVGHSIKKPKLKPREKIKKRASVKTVVKRLKEGRYTPCLPSNRSPLKTPTPGQKKKRRVLSSPGMTFLDSPEQDGDDSFLLESKNGKFFTSRSRAAATVQIGKNIKLAARYGDLTLKQREGAFIKKNVGRLEDQLEQYFEPPNKSQSIKEALSLPSVQANPRPLPTRVPSSPSPGKQRDQRKKSPKKCKIVTGSKNGLNVSSESVGEELQDMESILKDWDEVEAATENFTSDEKLGGGLRRSPRKHKSESPHKPKKKQGNTGSPRKSPRKLGQTEFPSENIEKTSPAKKLVRHESSVSSPRRSPRKLQNTVPLPMKNQKDMNSVSSPKSPSLQSSLKTDSQETKFFSIFDPKRRLTDQKHPKKIEHRPNRHTFVNTDDSQMMIDAGQKKFGAQQCSVCELVYEVSNPSEEVYHNNYHNQFNTLKFLGWKHEKVVRIMGTLDERVIMVSSEDPVHYWRKVEEIRQIVDTELGFSENCIRTKENTKVFFYILKQRIVGCLIAERISKAYKVIPQKSSTPNKGRLVCRSNTPTKVWTGISRLWVLQSERGKGIASTLVNSMRANMMKNYILNIDEIAFSDPTESGLGFAEKYTGKPDFLVYSQELL
ncbi:N-acetyltransferase ESCO2-like [Homarus americanus]|uniref:N-acetyltransferase ESCO2-like n=1 Tax=Homarus americanus TaxID=6706 RepID=UPI001C469CB9|nr:N-acetyltransferase ESCO2-like [Homarus americanus]